MDPISLAYFAFIIPVAAGYAAYIIYRFRGKHKTQIKNVRADELSGQYDYDIKVEKTVSASDMRDKE